MKDPRERPLNPYEVLSHYEKKRRQGRFTDKDRLAYRDLVEMFRKLNDQDQTATSLLIGAQRKGSEGSAVALQKTPVTKVQRRLRKLVHNILDEDPKTVEHSEGNFGHILQSPVLPLALASSDEPTDVELLCRAVCFRRQSSPEHDGDERFRENAAEALGTFDDDRARETLFSLLCSRRIEPDLHGAVLKALRSQKCPDIRRQCSELRALPKRKAVKHLARLSGCGVIRSQLDSLFHQSKYDRVFAAMGSLDR